MPRSLEERRAYAKGYNAGRQGSWPLHRPPTPPDEVTGQLVEALRNLRDGVDGVLAILSGDDEWVVQLGPLVDAADDALGNLGECLVVVPVE